MPSDYYRVIFKARHRAGLTQTQLAEKIGVSFATVNRWEGGWSQPMPLAWRQACRVLKLGKRRGK